MSAPSRNVCYAVPRPGWRAVPLARPDLKAGMSGPRRERQETAAKVGGRTWVVVSEAVAVCDIWGLRRFLIRVGYGLGSGDHSNRIVTLFSLPYGAPCGAPLDLVKK